MKLYKVSDMKRGWFIGDFEPNVIRTKGFEVGYLHHRAGEKWPSHYHKIATEINLLISGSMTICGKLINAGEIFVIEPMEVADPIFHDDCYLMTVKVPSLPGDKYETV